MDYFSSLNASSLDPDVPTLFELLSAHQLQDLISPSLRYILTFYAQRHPQYLLRLANRYDEIYAVLMGAVEYYHLKHWNSSFTEKFYGLKRTQVLTTTGTHTRSSVPAMFESHRRLSNKQIYASLFFAIGAPYIKEKLDARYDLLKGRYAFRSIESDRAAAYQGTWRHKLRFELDRFILKIYPALNSAQSLICLAFYLGFLFQKTTATSVVDMLVGFKYSRLSRYDYDLNDPAPSMDAPSETVLDKMTSLSGIKSLTLNTLSYTLPTSMFLLKFLEWWYSSDFANQMSKPVRYSANEDGNLDVPAKSGMPLQAEKTPGTVAPASAAGLCPLCRTPLTNPTLIETGVVFCYPCIYRYLEEKDEKSGGRCPVTGQRLLGCRYSTTKGEWEIEGLRRLML